MCYVAVLMGGEFGGEWICVYVWLSPFTVHLKLSQYCYFAIPQHTHTHTHTHTQTVLPVQGVSVQTLDGELRSHVPHSKSIDQQKIIKEKSDGDP